MSEDRQSEEKFNRTVNTTFEEINLTINRTENMSESIGTESLVESEETTTISEKESSTQEFCNYSQNIIKDCSEDEDFMEIEFISEASGCPRITRKISCPALLPFESFFSYYLAIALIFLFCYLKYLKKI